ncbi:hypothetical protein NYE69_28105 [Paenibacillus sp. FSL R5-0527]|uniref:hypothetical protein n=1 Tax=Paenibacillus sp. FSL R5-0527 TaxID=2975321 RepID=UPI0030F5AA2C
MAGEQKNEAANVIDYRALYDRLKDISAAKWTREIEMFSRLYYWKLNDRRERNGEM